MTQRLDLFCPSDVVYPAFSELAPVREGFCLLRAGTRLQTDAPGVDEPS